MEIREIFSVLGIEPTKDEQSIKNAYRERLGVTNPEENPEGFKRLRSAYEEACAYAERTEEEDEAGGRAGRDETPSGLWVERIKSIYDRIDSRIDLEQWKEVFGDDIFFSLEEEENCRIKLLRFLMDHFRLPTDVWKLMDEKMNLVRDAKQLRELFRADFINFVVSKCEHGEDIEFALFKGAPDALYDLFLNYYDDFWRALREDNLKQAAEALSAADELHIYHPAMEVSRANLLLRQEKKEEALTLMESLLQDYPTDDMVCYNAAETMWKLERREAAAAIYEELKARSDSHYMANLRLTEWYYSCGEYKRAKKCAENVLRVGSDDDFMDMLAKVNSELEKDYEELWEREHDWEAGMELGWCFLQDGRICRGIQLAAELDKLKAFQPAEKIAAYNGLLTKLYVEEAEYEDAVYMAGVWEKSLEEKLSGDDEEEREKDFDRIRQSHLIRIQCYRSLGFRDKIYFERALEEFSALETGTAKDIPLMLEKAQIYLETEEYELCLEITDRLIAEYQVYAAYATAMEAWRRQWDAGGVVRCARQCIEYYSGYARAYEHAANVYLALDHTQELKELLDEARKNGVESVILDAYRYQMAHKPPEVEVLNSRLKEFHKNFSEPLDNGQMVYYEKGLPILTEYLYWYPDAYMLRERALFHRSGRHYDEALADFEKSLADEPASPYALRGMALTYLYMGDCERSLIYLKRAILYLGDEEWPGAYAELALMYSRLGYHEMALNAYRQYEHAVEKDRRAGHLIRRMVWTLSLCGRGQEAYAKLNAFYAQGDPFEKHYYLTDLCQVTGQKTKAEELLQEWKKLFDAYENMSALKRMSPNKLQGTAEKLLPGMFRKSKEELELYDYVKNYAEYYTSMGWQELLFGDGKKAVRCLEMVQKGKAKDRKANGDEVQDDDVKEGLCDLIFACILTGEERKGRKHAETLRAWRTKDKYKSVDSYFEAEKGRVYLDFLADYYFLDESGLQKILDREADAETCRFCTYCICKELEAARILLLLRQGRKEEAHARLVHNMKVQPQDEFSMAIYHILEEK